MGLRMGLRMMKLNAENAETQASATHNGGRTDDRCRSYRLVHSSGEQTFQDLTTACAALRQHPGARLFVGSGRA